MKTFLIISPLLLAAGFFLGRITYKMRMDSPDPISLKYGITKIVSKDEGWTCLINNQVADLKVEVQTSSAGFSFRSEKNGDANAVYLPPDGGAVVLDRNGNPVDP